MAQFRTAASFYRAAAAAAAAASVRSGMRVVADEWRWELEGALLLEQAYAVHTGTYRAAESTRNEFGRSALRS